MAEFYTHSPRPRGISSNYAEFGGKLWPNGEFVMSQRCPKNLSKKKVQTTKEFKESNYARELDLITQKKQIIQPTNHQYAACGIGGESIESIDTGGGALVLSGMKICHTEKSSELVSLLSSQGGVEGGDFQEIEKGREKRFKKGQKGITSYSRRMIRNACDDMSLRYGRRRLGFATFTLPSLEDIFMVVLAKGWSEILRKFLQEYRRQLKRVGAPDDYVAVTEIQDKRWKQYGYVCPHLHLVYIADKEGKGDFYIDRHWMNACWDRVIRNHLSVFFEEVKSKNTSELLSELPSELPVIHARIDCQKIKKNASAYLSKYMSKGGAIVAEISIKAPELLPSAWLYMSSVLRKNIKDRIKIIATNIIEAIYYFKSELMLDEKIFYLAKGRSEIDRFGRYNYDFYEGEFEIPRKLGDTRKPLKLWYAVGKFSKKGLAWLEELSGIA